VHPSGTPTSSYVPLEFGLGLSRGGFRVEVHTCRICLENKRKVVPTFVVYVYFYAEIPIQKIPAAHPRTGNTGFPKTISGVRRI